MGVLISVSTVLFVILCALLIIIVLLQSDKSAGMGILGGSSQSAFGSSTADVITKITSVMVGIFMVGSLGLSILESNRARAIEKELLSPEDKATSTIEEKVNVPEKSGVNKNAVPAQGKK